jgi:hypothetical protein
MTEQAIHLAAGGQAKTDRQPIIDATTVTTAIKSHIVCEMDGKHINSNI